MADRLFTSQPADDVLSALRVETKLEKFILARMAFSLSLATDGANVARSSDFTGAEMKRPTFVGSDELFVRALIAQVHQRSDISEDDFYSNRSLIKDHIDNGCVRLHKLFEECGQDSAKLLVRLVETVEFEGRREARGKGLDIFIGRKILNKDSIVIEFNNSVRHANSHLAIMGKPGVGKTQFLLKLLADIRIQSGHQTNFILFDYKGDVVTNGNFVEVSKAQTFSLLNGSQNLPINPFVLPAYDDTTITVSAREKAESFASISSKLGVVQKGALAEAIRAAYAKRAGSPRPYPDFQDVFDIVQADYADDGKNDDSLVEVLRDLATFNLFWKHGSERDPLERLTNRTMVIDLHKMPVLKELVAYLVIERLYKEMAALPDSPVENGRRTIRCVLVIDEAHNYLPQKNIFLQRIIREGRSKGIVVFFASQSPNDYQQPFFNFQELLEFAFIFQCEGVVPASIQSIIGCSNKTAKDLQSEIAKLEPFQVIARSDNKTEEFTKFVAEAFYQVYK